MTAAVALIAQQQPDAELLRLGNAFEAAWAVERELNAHLDALPQSEWASLDEVLDLASRNTKAVAERILGLRASTFPGLMIKVRIASWCHSGEPIDREWLASAGMCEGSMATDGKSVLSILLDLAAMGDRQSPSLRPTVAARAA